MRNQPPSLATLFTQLDGRSDAQTGGVVPPVQPSTTFVRDENYDLTSADHSYARDHNTLYRMVEEILCQAEGAAAGRLFPSGMAAVAAVIRAVPDGGRIVMQSGIYWGVTSFARKFCARHGIDLAEVDCANLPALTEAVGDTKTDLVWIETPSNPYLKSVDIAACSVMARKADALLAVDSTTATPVLSQPITHGADIVVHSATKSINGHSDVLAGFVCAADGETDTWSLVCEDRYMGGAVTGSFDAWLLLRGMRTLPLRVERASANALAIAQHFENDPRIAAVLYPGLASDPGHAIARKQMRGGFGSLLSIRVKGGRETALTAVGRFKLFKRATSLGGVESLVEHRHTIEDTVPDDLLRLAVGIEDGDDLIADLDRALG